MKVTLAQRLIAVTLLVLPAPVITAATLRTSTSGGGCSHTGTSHSECSFDVITPNGSHFQGEEVADASYGQLHVVSTSDIRNVVGHIPATSTAYASFSDMITLTPRNDAMVNFIRLVWCSLADLHLVFPITEKRLVNTPPPPSVPPAGILASLSGKAMSEFPSST